MSSWDAAIHIIILGSYASKFGSLAGVSIGFYMLPRVSSPDCGHSCLSWTLRHLFVVMRERGIKSFFLILISEFQYPVFFIDFYSFLFKLLKSCSGAFKELNREPREIRGWARRCDWRRTPHFATVCFKYRWEGAASSS